jgi:hypothetical protein
LTTSDNRKALNRLSQFDLTYSFTAGAEFMMGYLDCRGLKSKQFSNLLLRMRLVNAVFQRWRNILRQNREILKTFQKAPHPTSFFFS